jgi:hypothetical protein
MTASIPRIGPATVRDRWVKVIVQLPVIDCDVQADCHQCGYVTAYADADGNWWDRTGTRHDVSRWRGLPEPPE